MSTPAGQDPAPTGAGTPHCYRHPDRETWIRCQRCDRPICPDCMRQAAVGFQCPECVREGARSTRTGRLPYGGQRSADPRQTTIGLIALNVVVFAAVLLSGGVSGRVFQWLSLLPQGRCDTADLNGYFPQIHDAALCAAQGGHWFPGVSDGAWWQVVTSVFTHGEVLHIGFNMVALWFLGPPLEAVLGRLRFLVVYLVAGLAGSAAVMVWSPSSSLTEGAIFGILAALIVIGIKLRAPVQQLWLWLGLNLVFTFTFANISWQGHIGGIVGGAAATAILVYDPRQHRNLLQVAGASALSLVVVAVIAVRALTLS